jgi:cobalt/nickel transport system ATP-binding protein
MTYAIKISELFYRYPDGNQALNGINIKIEQGEKVGIVGANGAGKSTLLNHINGILIGNGQIEVMGLPLSKKNLPQIRALVGLVFQNPDDQLFSTTVFDDVAYGPIYQGLSEEEINCRVKEALTKVGMSEFINRNSYHLSMGEKKRISIATVLSMQPEILILDEPTAGLDPRARRNLLSLLGQLPQTMLIASHDLDMVNKQCSRTVLLNNGNIVADGVTTQILGNEPLLLHNGL